MTTTNATVPPQPGHEALPSEVFEALIAYEDLGWEKRQTQSASKTLAFLQWVTQRPPVDLFAGYFRATDDGLILAVEDIRQRAETTTRVLEGILHRPEMPQSRWGINE